MITNHLVSQYDRAVLKMGYKASAEQLRPRELVEYAVLAGEVGLDSVWVSDHFQPWRHEGGHAPQALSWLAAVGERTQRVLLGTSVLTPTFRYNPAVLAQVFATLGSLYPGQIAVGSVPASSDGVEAAWPDFKERSARPRESIQSIRKLWTEDRVTFDGTYYRTQDATIYDKPSAPIPIYMPAGGPQMAKSVGRNADGFICTSGKGEELYTTLITALGEGAEATGRDVAGIDKMIEIKLSYARTRDEALENTRLWGRARTDARAEARRARPRGDAAPRRRAADRADRRALDHRDHARGGARGCQAVHRARVQPRRIPPAGRRPGRLLEDLRRRGRPHPTGARLMDLRLSGGANPHTEGCCVGVDREGAETRE